MRTKRHSTLAGLITVACIVALPALLYFAPSTLRQIEESKYQKLFKSIPEVNSVENFLNYDGTRFASLNVKSGGFVSLDHFDESAFKSTQYILVDTIGDMQLRCNVIRDAWGGGHDVVDMMRRSPMHLRLHNLGDFFRNYDAIERYMKQTIPNGESHKVRMANGTGEFWCWTFKL